MAEYDSSIALAKRLILKKGEKATLRTFAAAVDTPATPWDPDPASPISRDTSVVSVVLPFEFKGSEPLRFADGTLVRTGDRRFLVAASGLTVDPDLGSHLIRKDGTLWIVGNVSKLDPGGRAILFDLWCKQ